MHARRHSVRRAALAVCLAAAGALALPAAPTHAATLSVANCNDSGAGSLRQTIAQAANGDTVDLTHLTCGRIVLTRQLVVPQQHLLVQGPGPAALTIDGNHVGRVFLHTGSAALHLMGMTLANGYADSRNNEGMLSNDPHPAGGCVFSHGQVRLDRVDVHDCSFNKRPPGSPYGQGGGIYAFGSVRVYDSRLFDNTAPHGSGGAILSNHVVVERSRIYRNHANSGGGVVANGSLDMSMALLHDNTASSGGGAISTVGTLSIDSTAIYNNSGGRRAGAVSWLAWTGDTGSIVNSTISGNHALTGAAIVMGALTPGVKHPPLAVSNSTVAFNDETTTDRSLCTGAINIYALTLHSSIIARSRCNGSAGDDIGRNVLVRGAHNLVQRTRTPLPADTITANPLLAPLADNGGSTRTHALQNGSPAVDAGENPLGLSFDQRGTGFARVKGVAADIGAFEK